VTLPELAIDFPHWDRIMGRQTIRWIKGRGPDSWEASSEGLDLLPRFKGQEHLSNTGRSWSK